MTNVIFPLQETNLLLLEKEVWRDVVGYEGIYMVSSTGRVKSLRRLVYHSKYKYYKYWNQRFLTPADTSHCYLRYTLTKDGINEYIFAHRVVALSFLPNPNNKPFINHIDCNKKNNCVTNLEWCTNQENIRHYYLHQKRFHSNVAQKDMNGNLIRIWRYIKDVHKSTGYRSDTIAMCCKGKKSSAYGYIWNFV